MDVLSLLFCKSTSDQHSETVVWFWITLAAMAFVLANAGAELVVLWLGFAVGISLRERAAEAARRIRKAFNESCCFPVNAPGETWSAQQRIHAVVNMTIAVTARRYVLSVLQDLYAYLGLPHICLSSRLLPSPVTLARQ
ncbi:MAG: hypothetical protein NTV11_16740 [Rhodocyclales bacterium]|nr:hypothetical protein [Rhodocyclales bacterium]